jgi:hypothetical protein
VRNASFITAILKENNRLREALETIRDRHIPNQPDYSGGEERDWLCRQYRELRCIAIKALENKTTQES